jgi:hypothetical protein
MQTLSGSLGGKTFPITEVGSAHNHSLTPRAWGYY